MDITLRQLADIAALRRSAELYAQGADRRDAVLWATLVTDDCIIEGPGFAMNGRTEILAAIHVLAARFKSTSHKVHNQTVTITGDTADGETYCTADHLYDEGGRDMILSWTIRYQDRWRRGNDEWRFSSRKLVLDWEELYPRTQAPL